MAFPKPYRFYLMDGANYLYVDAAGTVQATVTPTELNYAPDGWQDIDITFERGWTYYGLFRLYTTPFKFVQDAAVILRWAYYLSAGIEKKITFKIEHFNKTIAVYDYETLLESDIDLSTFVDTFNAVEATIIEGGFVSKLKARENTTYEIEVADNPDVLWIKMDGIKLNCILHWICTGNTPKAFTEIMLPLTEFYNTEGVNTVLTPLSVDLAAFQSIFVANNTGVGPIDIDIISKLNFNAIMDPANVVNGVLKVRLQLTKITPAALISNTVIYTQSGLTPGSTTLISLDQIDSMTLPNNHQLELHILVDDGAGGGGTNDYQIDFLACPGLKVSFNSTVPTGYIPALRTKKVLDELVDQISDSSGTTAVSTLLDTTNVDKVITSGDAIRNLEKSKLKISFADYWKAINATQSGSLYYDPAADELILENKVYVFDPTVIANLGSVTNFKARPLTQEMYSKLKAGFGNFTYDEINGKDEFNQLTEFLLPFTRVKTEKDLTSPVRADMYGIEYTRLNLGGKTTTDADTDNENFFIHIESATAGTIPVGFPGEGEPYYELFRTPIDLTPGASYWEIENIMYPETAFNFWFSAKRQLDRWGNYLTSILYLLGSELIKFQVSSKNNPDGTKLKTSEGVAPTIIDEAADETISSYDAPLFYPILFDVETKEPNDIMALMAANPHGILQFDYKGNQFEGFIIKATTKPEMKKTQTYTLLATTNNTLSDIVYP